MEIELAKELMELFFHAPGVNGILVFEDNDYLGIVFKRDVEIGVMEGDFELYQNINCIRLSQLSDVLFSKENPKNAKIPIVDKAGKLVRIISYDEYLCQFDFEEFQAHFKIQSVLDGLDHPMMIASHFKKIIFANKAALEMTGIDIIGKNAGAVLKQFELKMDGKDMTLFGKKNSYNLILSHSITRNFSYLIYQFLPKN